ncbi:unnamed protein product [Lactuca virosa]|uniref:F-box domain-containing protein n=1 Tax=Lactuca virosa TaxID=75947 RepID=A0AAU9PG59_9ASTR|nr:unnamed protein product [Lactuca virosa]
MVVVSSSEMEDPPIWMEMPDEVMANILQRLGTKEILNNAWRVCTTWRRICKDPAMWKVIDVQKSDNDVEEHLDLDRLTKKLGNRSQLWGIDRYQYLRVWHR